MAMLAASVACVKAIGDQPMHGTELTAAARARLEELADHPQRVFFKKARKEMQRDRHYPKYHFLAPEHNIGDPNGLCHWRGNWHIFYQFRPLKTPGAEKRGERQTVYWGHAVSADLVHWKDLPIALYPRVGNDCFSGSALVEEDRTLLMYHATGKGNQVVESTDPLLLDWKLIGKHVPDEATIPRLESEQPDGSPYRVWDPCIFKKGDTYYSISGVFRGVHGKENSHLRTAIWHLFSSKDLKDWEYTGNMLENDRFTQVGDDGSCSYLWPLGEDKELLMFFSHRNGSQVMVGTFDPQTGKFVPESHQLLNSGPASACPAPGKPGEVIVVSNQSGGYTGQGAGNWNGLFTLPRIYGLGESGQLTITPAGNTHALRGKEMTPGDPLPSALAPGKEVVLDGIGGNALEIIAEIDPGRSSLIELNVLRSPDAQEYTSIRLYRDGEPYNRHGGQRWSLSIDTARGSTSPGISHRVPSTTEFLRFNNEPLRLRVFVDVSIIEVFANAKAHLAERSYPVLPESSGVSIRSTGGGAKLQKLRAWPMGTIH